MRLTRFAPLLAAGALLFTPNAHAWDAAGHMLVDQIAWNHLKPEVREKVNALLPALETTHNGKQPYNFVTAGAWMDDMRSKKGYAWSKWHYVTIPWTADGVAFALPEPPNVVWGIGQAIDKLKGKESAIADETQALAMLMHLIGDLHQPLHATDRDNDRGGNAVLIHGVPFTDLWPGTIPNLHAYWDKSFRFDARDGRIDEMWEAPFAGGAAEGPRRRGDRDGGGEAGKGISGGVAAGAPDASRRDFVGERESHAVGCKSAYPADADPSDDTHVITLTPEFAHASRNIAERRLVLAGHRVAQVLNELFATAK